MQHVSVGRAWLGKHRLLAVLGLLDFPICCYFIRVKMLVPTLQETPNHCGSPSQGHLRCGGE